MWCRTAPQTPSTRWLCQGNDGTRLHNVELRAFPVLPRVDRDAACPIVYFNLHWGCSGVPNSCNAFQAVCFYLRPGSPILVPYRNQLSLCRDRADATKSGRWDSNPRRSAWEADILPLNYVRIDMRSYHIYKAMPRLLTRRHDGGNN